METDSFAVRPTCSSREATAQSTEQAPAHAVEDRCSTLEYIIEKGRECLNPCILKSIEENIGENRELREQTQKQQNEIDERDTTVKELHANLEKVMQTAKKDQNHMKSQHQKEKKQMKSQHQVEKDNMKSQHQVEKDNMKSQHQVEKDNMKSQHQVEKDNMRSQHLDQIAKALEFVNNRNLKKNCLQSWRVEVQAKNKYKICLKLKRQLRKKVLNPGILLWKEIGIPLGRRLFNSRVLLGRWTPNVQIPQM